MTNKKNRLVSGVVILTVSNLLVKVIGMLYKIPLVNIIGDSGMGYFNSAYTIYSMFYMISTAGLPVAVSILISESRARGNKAEVKKIFRITVLLFLIIGLAGMFLMLFGSKLMAQAIKNDPSYICIIAIAPVLFFVCITSALRGYFQGCQDMMPTAVSQIIEAAGKLALGILFAVYAMKHDYSMNKVAAAAILGLTLSSAASMLFMIAAKFFKKEEIAAIEPIQDAVPEVSGKNIIKRLINISIPITVSASVLSLTSVIDLAIVMRRLQSIGFSAADANSIYGNYTAKAISMFNLPPVLVYPIALSIVPFITSAITDGNRESARKTTETSIKAAAIIGLPCALGLSVLAEPLLNLFFTGESVAEAARLLSVLGLSVFFVGLVSVTDAVLQAWRYERLPIISMLVGSAVKLITSYVLIGKFGIIGTPISTLLCYFSISAVNMIFIMKHTGVIPDFVDAFLRPLIASAVCVAAGLGVTLLLDGRIYSKLATLLGVSAAAVVYLFMLLLVKGLTEEDIMVLPGGSKISGILKKLHIFKQ